MGVFQNVLNPSGYAIHDFLEGSPLKRWHCANLLLSALGPHVHHEARLSFPVLSKNGADERSLVDTAYPFEDRIHVFGRVAQRQVSLCVYKVVLFNTLGCLTQAFRRPRGDNGVFFQNQIKIIDGHWSLLVQSLPCG